MLGIAGDGEEMTTFSRDGVLLEDWLSRVVVEVDGDLTGSKVTMHCPCRCLCCLETAMKVRREQEKRSCRPRCCLRNSDGKSEMGRDRVGQLWIWLCSGRG